jgi:hypothetical protein
MNEIVIVLVGTAVLGLAVFGWVVPRAMAIGAVTVA